MHRTIEAPTAQHDGGETHPAFALASVSRGSYSGEGVVLFQSEVRHPRAVTLSISRAVRYRDLGSDWLRPTEGLIEITMTESQWASLCASDSGRGIPVTLDRYEGDLVPGLELAPRLELQATEAIESAKKGLERVQAAMAALEEKNTVANRKALRTAIDHLPKSIEFATKQLERHVESVKDQVKADLEAEALRVAQLSREAIISEYKQNELGA